MKYRKTFEELIQEYPIKERLKTDDYQVAKELMQYVRELTIKECINIAKQNLFITQDDEPALGIKAFDDIDLNSVIYEN